MNEIIFKLSELESIRFIANNNIDFEKIDLCSDEVNVYFSSNQYFCIGQESAGLLFETFIGHLKKSIDQKLSLHDSLTQNLGFMWNEKLQGKSGFIMVPTSDNSGIYWVGLDYAIVSTYRKTNPHVTTWLYNDHKGNIILEITKLYKWSTRPDEPENPDFVTYDKFMKDYQPLIRRIIPRDVAIEWLKQAMQVYRSFFASEEDYIRACQENNW